MNTNMNVYVTGSGLLGALFMVLGFVLIQDLILVLFVFNVIKG